MTNEAEAKKVIATLGPGGAWTITLKRQEDSPLTPKEIRTLMRTLDVELRRHARELRMKKLVEAQTKEPANAG